MFNLQRSTNRYNLALMSSPPVGLNGLGGFWEDLAQSTFGPVTGAVQDQVLALKGTLRVIVGLSAVAAVTGVLSLFRGR